MKGLRRILTARDENQISIFGFRGLYRVINTVKFPYYFGLPATDYIGWGFRTMILYIGNVKTMCDFSKQYAGKGSAKKFTHEDLA